MSWTLLCSVRHPGTMVSVCGWSMHFCVCVRHPGTMVSVCGWSMHFCVCVCACARVPLCVCVCVCVCVFMCVHPIPSRVLACQFWVSVDWTYKFYFFCNVFYALVQVIFLSFTRKAIFGLWWVVNVFGGGGGGGGNVHCSVLVYKYIFSNCSKFKYIDIYDYDLPITLWTISVIVLLPCRFPRSLCDCCVAAKWPGGCGPDYSRVSEVMPWNCQQCCGTFVT